jgi:hypothetical protein
MVNVRFEFLRCKVTAVEKAVQYPKKTIFQVKAEGAGGVKIWLRVEKSLQISIVPPD